uniref:Uncharacterized protein n=1 Tax=Gallus gallus TaxID=9031 RepID=A0A8V1A957_CHICK
MGLSAGFPRDPSPFTMIVTPWQEAAGATSCRRDGMGHQRARCKDPQPYLQRMLDGTGEEAQRAQWEAPIRGVAAWLQLLAQGGHHGQHVALCPLSHPHVSLTEQKLPVQVGACDSVHVGDGDVPARPRCQPHHGKVLQQLAADGAGSHLRGTAAAAQRPSCATPPPARCSPRSTSGGPAPPGSRPRTRQSARRSGTPSAGRGVAVSGGGHSVARWPRFLSAPAQVTIPGLP